MKFYLLTWIAIALLMTVTVSGHPQSAAKPSRSDNAPAAKPAKHVTCDCGDICKKVSKEEQCGIDYCNAKTGN